MTGLFSAFLTNNQFSLFPIIHLSAMMRAS